MKSYLLASLFTVFILQFSSAFSADKPLQGQAKIDSLLTELPNTKGDTNEVKLLVNLSYYFAPIDTEKGIEYGEKAMKLSNKLNWTSGIATSYFSLGINYFKIRSKRHKAYEYHNLTLELEDKLKDKTIIAKTLFRIGEIYRFIPDYKSALQYYTKSMKKYESLDDKKGVAKNLTLIGQMHNYFSDFPKALSNFLKSLAISEELGDKKSVVSNLYRISFIYLDQSDYSKALDYANRALEIVKTTDDKIGKSNIYYSLGSIYRNQEKFDKSLDYFYKSLELKDGKYRKSEVIFNIAEVYHGKGDYTKALENYEEALRIFGEWNYLYALATCYSAMANLYVDIIKDDFKINPNETEVAISINKEINLNKAIEYCNNSIELYNKTENLSFKSKSYKILSDAYMLKGEMTEAYKSLIEHQKLKDSVFNQSKNKEIAALEKAREDDLKQKEIEKQKIQIAEQEKREQLILYFSIGFIIVMAVVMFIIYRLLKRSDKLLYNVLPVSIAMRLKKKEHPISDYFTQASIVFIDIVNFTELSKDEDPRRVVEALNKIFTHYDTIANKYGLEKIKTIGDSYMAAAGIPEVQKDNTHRAAQMALEVKQLMSDYRTADGTKIEVRIGLDCGPVVAGVIGENKFIYDMWSDAVNTASRMESSSESGQVHITDRFKKAVSEYEEFEYVERGEIEIKGKGMMKTYYIESKESVHSEATK